MKKLLLMFLLMAGTASQAQLVEKQVTLSLAHHELLLILQKSNSFSRWVQIPERVNEVYAGDVLQYTEAKFDSYTMRIMPDDEFRFVKGTSIYYLRFPNKVIYGYSMRTKPDGTIVVDGYKGAMGGINDYEFKPVK